MPGEGAKLRKGWGRPVLECTCQHLATNAVKSGNLTMEGRQKWNNLAEMPVGLLPLSLHSIGHGTAGNQMGQHGHWDNGELTSSREET